MAIAKGLSSPLSFPSATRLDESGGTGSITVTERYNIDPSTLPGMVGYEIGVNTTPTHEAGNTGGMRVGYTTTLENMCWYHFGPFHWPASRVCTRATLNVVVDDSTYDGSPLIQIGVDETAPTTVPGDPIVPAETDPGLGPPAATIVDPWPIDVQYPAPSTTVPWAVPDMGADLPVSIEVTELINHLRTLPGYLFGQNLTFFFYDNGSSSGDGTQFLHTASNLMLEYEREKKQSAVQTISVATNDGVEAFGSWSSVGIGCEWGDLGIGNTDGGMSFTGVNIPAGSTLLTAKLDFTTSSDSASSPGTGTLFADPGATAGDPQAPGAGNLPLANWWGRKATTDLTGLSFAPSTSYSIDSEDKTTVNRDGAYLLKMLQEVIDEAGWASGNRLNLGMHATGSWTITEFTEMTDQGPVLTLTWI